MSNDPPLLEALRAASDMSGERIWELPLFDERGIPTGLTASARAATLDTTVTVSVVVSFAPRATTP